MGKGPEDWAVSVYRLRLRRLASLPVPILFVVMAVLWAADLQGSYESPHLLLVLNVIFSLLVSLFVAYLLARTFLVRGTPGPLLLGCGVILWGLAGVLGPSVAHGDVNISITIHNCCTWLSALCHLTGVLLSLRPRQPLSPTGLWLPAAYAHALGAAALVTLSVLAGWIPTFFVQGQGGTPLRQFVLMSAIIMFALTAALLMTTSPRPVSAFTYWYALALTLIVTGLAGVTLQSFRGSILGWTARATQLLGCLYMLIAALASVRESRVWGISLQAALRVHAAALRESEERYRTLFETAPDAIVVHRDGRILCANDTALRLTGAGSFAELAQHGVLDFFRPEEHGQALERIGRAMAGDRLPVREARLRRLDGQEVAVEFHTAPVDFQGARAIQTIIRDITERKHAEEALRELNATLESKVVQRTAELAQRARQLQKLTLELARAEERERKRVADILHEDLQQQIAGAKFELNLLRDRAQSDPSQQLAAAGIDQILKKVIGMSRSLSHELSPAVFYGNDLGEALTWLAGQVEAKHGLTTRVEVCGAGTLQSESVTVFLFRAAREMLSNVVRHAGVHEAEIRLRRMGRYVGLSVSDRGRGFDPRDLKETPGFGLLGIRERVELLGGRTKIRAATGRGTVVRIVVPDAPENEHKVTIKGFP